MSSDRLRSIYDIFPWIDLAEIDPWKAGDCHSTNKERGPGVQFSTRH